MKFFLKFYSMFLAVGVAMSAFMAVGYASAAVDRADSRVFNASWYLNAYPDLLDSFGNNTSAAKSHWLNSGIYECRQGAMGFWALDYLGLYPDVRNAVGNRACVAAIDHYLTNGINEGRVGRYILDAKVFDPLWYLSAHPDLKAAFGSDLKAVTNHWLANGSAECRQAKAFFSSQDYLNKYIDLVNAFGRNNCPAAAQHYVHFGFAEGRFINSVKVYAGGVAGILDLKNTGNSTNFRGFGGGLYIHSWAWGKITPADRQAILKSFQGSPIALEFGYNLGWGAVFRDQYQIYGIDPKYITANAFDSNNIPSVDGWKDYIKMLRDSGVPNTTKIYPTFEYQNYHTGTELLANKVSTNMVFQSLISISGGIVLDTPPGHALARENAYLEWVADAITWTKNHGYTAIVIVSPHFSGSSWALDTHTFINFLASRNAIPNEFVSENYAGDAWGDPNYPNVVGNENNINHTLGLGLNLLRGLF